MIIQVVDIIPSHIKETSIRSYLTMEIMGPNAFMDQMGRHPIGVAVFIVHFDVFHYFPCLQRLAQAVARWWIHRTADNMLPRQNNRQSQSNQCHTSRAIRSSDRHFDVREVDGAEVELARDGLAVARRLDLVRPVEAAERHASAGDVALEVRAPLASEELADDVVGGLGRHIEAAETAIVPVLAVGEVARLGQCPSYGVGSPR